LILRLFGVPLAMVRIVGGIILMKIGFEQRHVEAVAADQGEER
jgi:small neutral amino acid transporter SnatA (MarC family)